jgi:hypothetical protein
MIFFLEAASVELLCNSIAKPSYIPLKAASVEFLCNSIAKPPNVG